MLRGMPLIWVLHLHSNMFLLILIWNEWFRDENLHLHSNMFLLIQEIPATLKLSVFVFTFQYVSINTVWLIRFSVISTSFTFQYVSINTLLDYFGVPINPSFTFQYVSINTVVSMKFSVIKKRIYIPICFY